MKLGRICEALLGLPKTIYFNFRMFPIRTAIRMPVFLSSHVWLEDISGEVELPEKPKFAGVKIGFSGVGIFDWHHSRTILQLGGRTTFKGKAYIGHGSRISVGKNGHLTIGDNFQITAETAIICHHSVTFGRDCMVSWQCQFMDTDFHSIYENGILKNPVRPIHIRDHCWIGSRCLILKGTELANNCVLGGGQYSDTQSYRGKFYRGWFSSKSCV